MCCGHVVCCADVQCIQGEQIRRSCVWADLAAAVVADPDGSQADSARPGVDEHGVLRLEAAAHDKGVVRGQVRGWYC